MPYAGMLAKSPQKNRLFKRTAGHVSPHHVFTYVNNVITVFLVRISLQISCINFNSAVAVFRRMTAYMNAAITLPLPARPTYIRELSFRSADLDGIAPLRSYVGPTVSHALELGGERDGKLYRNLCKVVRFKRPRAIDSLRIEASAPHTCALPSNRWRADRRQDDHHLCRVAGRCHLKKRGFP